MSCILTAQVLQTMAWETGVRAPAAKGLFKKAAPAAKPLESTQLELAIALVQRVSDEVMQVSDWEVFAPDEKNVLARSTDLVYDGKPGPQGHGGL